MSSPQTGPAAHVKHEGGTTEKSLAGPLQFVDSPTAPVPPLSPPVFVPRFVEYISDDSSDDAYENDPEIILSSIGRSMTINFSICATYTNWKPREAFREMVQNWRDAIIRSFDLDEKDFSVIRQEKISGRDIDIVYKVPSLKGAGDRKEWLGYIRFKGRDGEGTVEITNRSATLQPWHLDFGGTDKNGDVRQAGAHGEGLKIALLVFLRSPQNHSVRCRTGGVNWTFNFTTRGRLVARLRRLSPEARSKLEDQAQRLSTRTLLPCAAKSNGDVQFILGEQRRGRDQYGRALSRSRVKLEHFNTWIESALFLQSHEEGTVVSTDHGDLLTGPKLRGNIFLKGLLLSESTPSQSGSITNLPLKFGYNFAFGQTNRERQSVTDAAKESTAILAIWKRILVVKPEKVQELSDLLNSDDILYADVAGARDKVDLEMASRLRDYLFREEGKWYYSWYDKSNNPRLHHIIQGLECEGVEITDLYWTILRRHNLVRTAEEEENRRFTAAPPTSVPQTVFATSLSRLLSACMRACPVTRGMVMTFVEAGSLHLQLFYSEAEQLFRMHERWLSRDGAIMELGLPTTLTEHDSIFHSVKRLFSEALDQLPNSVFLEDGDGRSAEWRRKLENSLAEQRLLNYFRMWNEVVVGSPPTESPTLSINWYSGSQKSHHEVEVQCHRSSQCSYLRDRLLTAEDARSDKMKCLSPINLGVSTPQTGENGKAVEEPLRCRFSRCSYSQRHHSETYLWEGEEYFFVLVQPGDSHSIVFVSSSEPAMGSIPSRHSSPSPQPVVILSSPSSQATEPPIDLEHSPRLSPSPVNSIHLATDMILEDDYYYGFGGGVDKLLSPKPAAATKEKMNYQKPLTAQESTPTNQWQKIGKPELSGLFALGHRLQNLNILEIDSGRWYEAQSPENVRAVIGIMKGEKSLPEETRKRRRVAENV